MKTERQRQGWRDKKKTQDRHIQVALRKRNGEWGRQRRRDRDMEGADKERARQTQTHRQL